MPKLKSTLRMYKDFFAGYIKYRQKIRQYDKWMKKYADAKELTTNPHRMYLTNLKIWLAENEEIYGQRLCPCFEATGDRSTDRNLICPCTYAPHDIEAHGTCHCNLFGRADLAEEDWRKQDQRIMKEYRIPLKTEGKTVDTRGVPQDKYRGMDVPDPVHQLKLSLQQVSGTFHMIVEREQSARNIRDYCRLKGIQAGYEAKDGYYEVTVQRD